MGLCIASSAGASSIVRKISQLGLSRIVVDRPQTRESAHADAAANGTRPVCITCCLTIVDGNPGGAAHQNIIKLEELIMDQNLNPDPFDPASLRLDQSFAEGAGVKKLLTTVPVRKPNRQDFVRVHPDPAHRLTPAGIIELRDERETYLVAPSMADDLARELTRATLFLAINRQGVLFLWPVKLPGADGKHNEWHRSAAEAADEAMKHWVRVTANMSLGAYEVYRAQADIPEPTWPDLSLTEILKIAFRDRIVDRPDHPLIKKLHGAI
jgi:hypothetical protein